MIIAHVSDLHVGANEAAEGRARAVVGHLAAMDPRPDLLLVSGDVADHGTPQEYAVARDVLSAWPGPLVVCTGNHDRREAFARGLLDREADGPVESEVVVGGVRLVVLDSLVPAPEGERVDHGELSSASLARLQSRLSADATPTLVVFHHPPAGLGLPALEDISLTNDDAYAAIVARHPQVVATLVGHSHTATASMLGGRPLLVGGGVVSLLQVEGEPGPPVRWDGPAMVAFHHVEPDRITTHWRPVDVG